MADDLERQLRAELDELRRRGLGRDTVLDGRHQARDFGSNDYLGLARDPAVVEAMAAAVREFGAGGRAARLLKGGSPIHAQCEQELARWLGVEAALLFPSGYQANLGLVTALVGRGDAIISDRDNHASLIDAARLSRARVLVHDHLDLADLERALRAAAGARRRLVLTEGIFSMAGDAAPLAAMNALCREHDAWLVVDEAHSIGVLGDQGRGAWAEAAVEGAERLLARTVTGGKALGVAGAWVAASATVRELLIHRARSFLFTTAPPPAVAAGLRAAIERCRLADAERAAVRARSRQLAQALGLPEPAAAIVPVPVGDAAAAVELARQLAARGFYAPAVRPPTVAPGASGLRIVCHADHTCDDVEQLIDCLQAAWPRAAAEPVERAARPMPVTCVVGTDTGVGKTIVSAILMRAARSVGKARYWKPVQTGDDDDSKTVAELAGLGASAVLPNRYRFALPASPHEAAAAEQCAVSLPELQATLRGHRADGDAGHLVLEFAGGLMVPLSLEPLATQADWLAGIEARVAVVARSGLGTLNHTMLTIEALQARRVRPAALFLVGERHPSNRATLAQMTGVERLFEVPHWRDVSTAAIDAWLADNDVAEWFRG